MYLISDEDGVMLSYDPSTKLQYGDRYDFVDEAVFPIEEGCEVEYVRKDTFIEKACEWLRNNSHNYANNALGKEYLVNDFKNYIEKDKL